MWEGFCLRAVVGVRSKVELVSGHEPNACLRVKGKRQARYHLKVQLVILIQRCEVALLYECPRCLKVQADAVVEVPKPYDCVWFSLASSFDSGTRQISLP